MKSMNVPLAEKNSSDLSTVRLFRIITDLPENHPQIVTRDKFHIIDPVKDANRQHVSSSRIEVGYDVDKQLFFRLETKPDADGQVLFLRELKHDANGQLTYHTVVSHKYDADRQFIGSSYVERKYDADGQLLFQLEAELDANGELVNYGVTKSQHDAGGRLIGYTESQYGDTNHQLLSQSELDAHGQLIIHSKSECDSSNKLVEAIHNWANIGEISGSFVVAGASILIGLSAAVADVSATIATRLLHLTMAR
ncbi:hypothetical protein SK355_09755 [Candidatus Fukatsuia symbiotica]|uniref:Uncharacterized protein n=1 Tax=Candidatus Fukatsuia symbiotica TaxID=1878942 RepID=A0A2U8I3I0_9GAMM|nr:hypothetical protein [Candidatus Fukatsuia symbiotica]AWK13671.1 hypothetical protein CCS41_02880 [Candidatus Fukatsuia symbiotica]MEA9445498.1 hypothetical protein [Candidatus Fukatsuia symbiotica]